MENTMFIPLNKLFVLAELLGVPNSKNIKMHNAGCQDCMLRVCQIYQFDFVFLESQYWKRA